MNHRPRRLLVTGGAGFIGANFVHHWLAGHRDDRLLVLDALTYAGNLRSLQPVADDPRLRFVKGSICDTELVEQLLREERIDTLVHFAAESHVDRSITGPDAFIDTNVVGTHSLLKAARSVWLGQNRVEAHHFHHVSTDEVYGTLAPTDPPFAETTPYAPNSPYSASKAASDHLVRAYHHTYGLRTTTSNCSNNYGPYHFPEKLIPLCLINILFGRPLPIYGDGQQIRDWLYVTDHCRGIEAVIERGQLGETYNIGGKNEKSNLEVVTTLCTLLDQAFAANPELAVRFPDAPAARGLASRTLITHVQDRAGHDRRYAIDARKIEQALQFRPLESFESGIARTVTWYLDHEAWWREVMDGSYRDWIQRQYG